MKDLLKTTLTQGKHEGFLTFLLNYIVKFLSDMHRISSFSFTDYLYSVESQFE
jgi:hypothetical protein